MNKKRFVPALLSGALAISMLAGCSRSLIQTYISGTEPVMTVTGNETAAALEWWVNALNSYPSLAGSVSVSVTNSIYPNPEGRPAQISSSDTPAVTSAAIGEWLNACYEEYKNPYPLINYFYIYEKLDEPCSYEELETIQLSRINQIVTASNGAYPAWTKAINQYAETMGRDTVYIHITTSVREDTTDSCWAVTGMYIY